jgi:Flp pilus assembly protein TadD
MLWGKVLDATPSDVDAALRATKCMLDAGDLAQAAQFARMLAQLDPQNVLAHRVLHRFFLKNGMEANARREEQILETLKRA